MIWLIIFIVGLQVIVILWTYDESRKRNDLDEKSEVHGGGC